MTTKVSSSRYQVNKVIESIKAAIPNHEINPEHIGDHHILFKILVPKEDTIIRILVNIREDGSEEWYLVSYPMLHNIASSLEEFLSIAPRGWLTK